jgi:hypothetical protein
MKENIGAIKEGLSSEEKFFETVVNLEKIYKKYKFIIWAAGVALVAYFVISAVNSAAEEERIATANSAYATLLEKKGDESAEKTLKAQSPALYDLYRFRTAMINSDLDALKDLRNSKAFGIADMAKYQYAMLSDNSDALLAYINEGGVYYRDIALLNAASTYMKQSKISEAKALLEQVKEGSAFFEQAQTLMHFGVTK